MASNRNRAWADRRFAGEVVAAAAVQAYDLLSVAPTVDTLTAIRIIGDLTFQYTVSVTITDSLSSVDVGIGVTSAEAFAAGGTSLPSPTAQDQYPPRGWLYAATLPVWEKAESTGVIHHAARFQFDLRAMRKIDKGVLFMVIEQNNVTVGGSMQLTGRTRVLCLT